MRSYLGWAAVKPVSRLDLDHFRKALRSPTLTSSTSNKLNLCWPGPNLSEERSVRLKNESRADAARSWFFIATCATSSPPPARMRQRCRVAKGSCATWNLRTKAHRWNWQTTAGSQLARLLRRLTSNNELVRFDSRRQEARARPAMLCDSQSTHELISVRVSKNGKSQA